VVHQLTQQQARRIAVCAQGLSSTRPGGIVEAIDALAVVNIDPTAAIAPSADHILWSRIGWPYRSADLARAVEEDRAVFEWAGFYRPMTDLPLYLPMMRAWPPYRDQREWMRANDGFARNVLTQLRDSGPLRTGEIPDTSQVPWKSSGWTNERNVTQMLEFLVLRGDVAIAGRDGKERIWDLSERVYTAPGPELSDEDAARGRAQRRLGSLGVARAKSVKQPVEPIDVGEIGEEARIDGVTGVWRVDPVVVREAESFSPRTALLSPFDRLVFDRVRAREIFGFEYIVEMYKPAAKRRWGYFALPILHGDRLVGKLDAAVDRRAGVLRVNAIHEDVVFGTDIAEDVHAEIRDLATWLGVDVVGIDGS
jgi:uncharacterized protein YcaQ